MFQRFEELKRLQEMERRRAQDVETRYQELLNKYSDPAVARAAQILKHSQQPTSSDWAASSGMEVSLLSRLVRELTHTFL